MRIESSSDVIEALQVCDRAIELQRDTLARAYGPDGPLLIARARAIHAATIAALDLVITVDTMVAHLAGALGVPTFVALQYVPDWRWMFDRPDSPWYPTMRLFRQRTDGDWSTVFGEIESALDDFMRKPVK